jgi:hypothetical protein
MLFVLVAKMQIWHSPDFHCNGVLVWFHSGGMFQINDPVTLKASPSLSANS